MAVSLWHAELAWLGPGLGLAERVLVEVEGERIAAVTEGADPPPGAARLAGVLDRCLRQCSLACSCH